MFGWPRWWPELLELVGNCPPCMLTIGPPGHDDEDIDYDLGGGDGKGGDSRQGHDYDDISPPIPPGPLMPGRPCMPGGIPENPGPGPPPMLWGCPIG